MQTIQIFMHKGGNIHGYEGTALYAGYRKV